MDWIIPMNVGLICDIIGAVFITKSIFSLRFLRSKVTFPDNPSEQVKKFHESLKETSTINIRNVEEDKDIKYLDDVGYALNEAKRILGDRKHAKIGLFFLVVGFSLQIIANSIIFYNFH